MSAEPRHRDGPAPGRPSRTQRLAGWLLSCAGWRVEIAWPPTAHGVIIVYPHTSNWDFAVGFLARLAAGLPARWIGKDTLFRWPVAGLLRWMGGIPVNRSAPGGLLEQLAAEMRNSPCLWLALAPEGTRARTDHWKSGFYRLALRARVPVGLGFVDYRRKAVGVGPWLDLSGEVDQDLARMRAFYQDKVGLHPGQAGDIRFRPEGPERGGPG